MVLLLPRPAQVQLSTGSSPGPTSAAGPTPAATAFSARVRDRARLGGVAFFGLGRFSRPPPLQHQPEQSPSRPSDWTGLGWLARYRRPAHIVPTLLLPGAADADPFGEQPGRHGGFADARQPGA